ncbi:MAG: hypothetical protein GF320_02485, partial [Armatimonadia bacterium]|nr:hypothetical protein [Armatimonadia bacterium]
GEHEAEYYTGQKGHELRREVGDALADEGTDADAETLIIFQNLLQTDGNKLSGSCPYYGGGDHLSGTAWVTDHAILDTLNLTRTEPTVYDNERPYSLGKYNSVYIGGAAHELGHALGLPHVLATPAEAEMGTTLMGSGNYTFREEVRGEGKGSFLSDASALVLSTHPLFRGSDHGKDDQVSCDLLQVRGEPAAGGMVVRGTVAASQLPRGVIAFCDPDGHSDYNAHTWTVKVDDAGRFKVRTSDFEPGGHELRLSFVFPGGQVITHGMPFIVDEAGVPDHRVLEIGRLHREGVKALEEGDDQVARDLCEAAVRVFDGIPGPLRTAFQANLAGKAGSLMEVAASTPATNPTESPADLADDVTEAYLSDLAWESAEVGWDEPFRDRIPDGKLLESGERYHAHGLYAHSASRYVYRLGGEWTTLETSYGLQQGAQGSVIFVVLGDGEELLRSDEVTDFVERSAQIDLKGVDVLELVVEEGGHGNYQDCSVWFAPRILR